MGAFMKVAGRFLKLIVTLVITTEVAAVSFIWLTPPRTSYMLQEGGPIAYQFVSIDHISRYVLAATIANEDQQLGTREGAFDLDDFNARVIAYLGGRKDPSGSTIPQQLAKNIYLWPDQNALRKALEAGLAAELSLTLSPKRILELYLNYAQFGPNLYGICAATWYYFGHAPYEMTPFEAAQLIGVLPIPERVRRLQDGGIFLSTDVDSLVWKYVNGAANVRVPRQLEGLGGWEAAVATIGITDRAADHSAKRSNPDACSTMPEGVRLMLASATQ
ncbi:biosynthetic peptidoglycan transglycosylase [Arthrobacter sp. M4]|uniref:biosynthetic peptidoglycan transglycosylase n=1 Tax=Arthrobacter sp. M4 TaxID=218160 RepID=UPI001CDD1A5B|nr:biosynthetic peptidoglycan transglycosylase [Arthrobacter sp. M4]MCA4131647.1 transglycosylase domain-containing protein [Arthrobacter sp. M4]